MLKCCFESKQITYNDIKHKQLNYNDIKHKQLNYDKTKPNLQQLVSTFEAAVDSDRSITEDEADVMVGTDLHSFLHINSPLQADSQAPALTKLWQLGHLLSKIYFVQVTVQGNWNPKYSMSMKIFQFTNIPSDSCSPATFLMKEWLLIV